MVTTIDTKVTITLQLSQREADWLHQMMQNPFPQGPDGDCNPANEDPRDREMRRRFFQATEVTGGPHDQ